MPGHQCYHCKQWVEEGEAHDCWTTTEQALTRDLSDDLRDAWERLRETAAEFGEQRIYASHKSIMFSRRSCYFFVRPKRHYLEVCLFLGRAIKAPQVRRADRASATKIYNMLRIQHRDEVEAPVTDWLREAYDFCEQPRTVAPRPKSAPRKSAPANAKAPARKAKAAGTAKASAKRSRAARQAGRRGSPTAKRSR